MKILIVMGGFFPGKKYGGPPVSVDNFCSLMSEYECYVVTRNHDLGETNLYHNITEGVWYNRENCKVIYLSDKNYCKKYFEKVILEIGPDVIYLQGLYQKCILPCLQLAKKHDVKVMIAPRGEICANALAIKKFKKKLYLYLLNVMGLSKYAEYQSTSDEETSAIQKYFNVPSDRIHLLTNIPSIPKKLPSKQEKKAGTANLIFLARIHPKKNLLYALKCLASVNGTVNFDIYGPIEDKLYWEDCQRQSQALPANVTVNYCGQVDHSAIHETFAKYDAFLFPTLSENYGHVIIESLMAGTPVIISNQTPWLDLKENNAGWVCSLDDMKAFVDAIQSVIDTPDLSIATKATKSYAIEKNNLEDLKRKYTSAFG